MKRATITVDDLAKEFFPKPDAEMRGYLDILEELQRRLQDKGDDPRYGRIIFAVEGQDKYVEIDDKSIYLAGVFPRVSAVRCAYGKANRGLKNGLSVNIRDTLVVANNEEISEMWETELKALEYSINKV